MVMVWPASKSSSTPQPHLLLFLYATGCFLLSMSHSALVDAVAPFSFSFDFSNTSTYLLDDFRFEGDAALNGNLVDLTCKTSVTTGSNCSGTGRISYNHPVRFYDDAMGEVANFSTRFTFAIKPNKGGNIEGDGMAFFLSGYPSRLPFSSGTRNLGLQGGKTALGVDRYVAIKFKTYNNTWDLTRTKIHIGIDISSARSSANTTSLPSYSLNGTMTTTISFDSTTKMLIASLQFDERPSLRPVQVSMQLPNDVTSLLPPEVVVGFCAATGTSFEFHRIISWSFSSTLAMSQKTKVIFNRSLKVNETTTDASLSTGDGVAAHMTVSLKGQDAAVLGVAVALVVVLVIWSFLAWCMWKRRLHALGAIARPRRFEYWQLYLATNGFADGNKIGAGGFGVVYKGTLKDEEGKEQQVAVKKIKDSSGETKDFVAELITIGQISHGNLVRLEGWCCSKMGWNLINFMCWCCKRRNFKLYLVYELVSKGNLHDHLCDKQDGQVLPWTTRYKIVEGIVSGLHYLHHGCDPYILHRDIKPENILLDDHLQAKLGDFGLSRVGKANETSVQTAIAVGSPNYMDPLCKKNGHVKFRRSSDIYSFGLVLLEIAHGQNNRDLVRQQHTDHPETFTEFAADKKLRGKFDKTQMERVIVLGLRCSDPDELQRPSLIGAMQFLEHGGELLPATNEERRRSGAVRDTPSSEEQTLMPHGTVRSC